VLIRIETRSGHGSSNVTKAIETTADEYAFFLHNVGVKPKYE
jgi:prolyl oligopeptidase